jgi:hypothetical protein
MLRCLEVSGSLAVDASIVLFVMANNSGGQYLEIWGSHKFVAKDSSGLAIFTMPAGKYRRYEGS